MNALRLVALLTYTFGAFAYGAILYVWVTETGRRGWATHDRQSCVTSREMDVVNGGLLVLTFLWFCCNAGLILYGFVPRRTPWALDVATICMAYAFPPVIMHLTLAEVAALRQIPPRWRAALWPVYAAAVAVPAWSISVLASPEASGAENQFAARLLGFGLSAMFLIAAAFSMSIIGRYGEARDHRSRQSRRWMLRLFGLMAAVFVVMVVITYFADQAVNARVPIGAIVELAAKSLPLVFMFVGTYNENRFEFFDLFVKRGASVVVTLAGLTVSFALLLPLLRLFAHTWADPWLFAVILLPTAVAIPWINRYVGAVLDRRWLGRRYSAVEAVKHFIGSLRSATTEDQLRQQARSGLEEIFGAKADVLLGGNTPASTAGEQDIPVRAGDRTVGRFVLGPRASEAPYFSQDLALLTSLADVFSHVLENLHLQERKLEQEQRAQELSLHASRSEMKALRAQINPHFLFNALNSIAGLIHRDPVVADRTIEQLADVFRYALRGAESEWAALDDELDFVRAYLEVERARFGERLHTEVKIDASARGARVPTMIVQTLVENAVKHGAASVRGRASVLVTAREESGRLVMSVADNGPGFSEADPPSPARPRGGYGLVNIRQRIEGYFGSQAALSVDRSGGVTTVSVTLPLLRQEPRAPHPQEIAR
jgi:anti-sigma regulatory factor (Ser/Thr protein kinase)